MSMAARFFPPGLDPLSAALEALRRSIVRLRDGAWNEELRQEALRRAAALAALRWPGETKEVRACRRAIVSLLAIRGAEAVDLHASIGERLFELIDRLGDGASSRAG